MDQESGQESAQQSGHLMLITPERVFYAGLLGRPRERCPGAFNIYVAIEGSLWLSAAGGRESHEELLVVSPNVRHTISSDHRSVICLVIEPETVRAGALEALVERLSGPQRPSLARRARSSRTGSRRRLSLSRTWRRTRLACTPACWPGRCGRAA